jgi:hypothetical protein
MESAAGWNPGHAALLQLLPGDGKLPAAWEIIGRPDLIMQMTLTTLQMKGSISISGITQSITYGKNGLMLVGSICQIIKLGPQHLQRQ